MKTLIKTPRQEFMTVTLILNSLCFLIMISTYKPQEKGIEGILFSLAAISLCSLFALLGAVKYLANNIKQYKMFLLLGIAYILVISLLINRYYIKDVEGAVICTSVTFVIPFIVALVSVVHRKVVRTCINAILLISGLSATLPIILFAYGLFHSIMVLFN